MSAAPAWSLYERTEVLAELLDLIEDPARTDEERDGLLLQLEEQVIGTREKVDAIGKAISSWEASAAHALSEMQRLSERRRMFTARIDRLKGTVEMCMERLSLKKLEGITSSFRRQKNAPSVHIWNPALLPAECYRSYPTPPPEPDKTLIKQLISSGTPVPGAALVESHHIRRA